MTSEMNEVGAFARLLSDLGIRFVIVGSYASSAHGQARSTQDVDFIADLPPECVDQMYEALHETHYIDTDSIRRAIRERRSFNVIHLATMLKIDVFVAGKHGFAQRQLDRAHPSTFGDALEAPVPIASPEDTVVAKLQWYRKGGEKSERQWNDVLGVLRVQRGRLDDDYLFATADEQRVRDLLDRAVAQVEAEERALGE